MTANIDECEAAGLDAAAVARIAKGLERYGAKARALGLTVFGGSGSGTLRFDDGGKGPLIVAGIYKGIFDGGDGGESVDENGLMRGEG